MSLTLPAPFWRRIAAAIYDGLLLLGLWVATSLLEIVIRGQLLGLPRHLLWLQCLMLAVGGVFFCLSWTRGGQTPGMRAWRLQVQRFDGAALRLPVALVRYLAMLLTWAAALSPVCLLIPGIYAQTEIRGALLLAGLLAALATIPVLFGSQRRAPCDWLAGTEVRLLPEPAGP